jgi:hypothetical protein
VKRTAGVTRRQAMLIDWMKHPTGLPDHPAVRPENAMWSARDIVERTGLYTSRRAALDDLNALTQRLTLRKFGNRYVYGSGWLW